jgi:hypothetical protein
LDNRARSFLQKASNTYSKLSGTAHRIENLN